MAQKIQTWENYALGVQPTTGSGGGNGDDPLSLVSFPSGASGTIVNSQVIHGSQALHLQSTTTAFTSLVELKPDAVTRIIRAQAHFIPKYTPSTSGGATIIQFRSSSGILFSCAYNSDRKLGAASSGGTWNNSSPSLSLENPYALDYVGVQNATAPSSSNGRLMQRVTDLSTGQIIQNYDSGYTLNMGTAEIQVVRMGKSSGNDPYNMIFDTFRIEAGVEEFFDPYSVALPTLLPTTLTATNWTTNSSGLLVAVTDANDSTYAESPLDPSLYPFEVQLRRIQKPSGNLLVKFRGYRVGGNAGTWSAKLMDGATQVATGTVTGTLGTSTSEFTATFATADISDVTTDKWNSGTLRVVITGSVT